MPRFDFCARYDWSSSTSSFAGKGKKQEKTWARSFPRSLSKKDGSPISKKRTKRGHSFPSLCPAGGKEEDVQFAVCWPITIVERAETRPMPRIIAPKQTFSQGKRNNNTGIIRKDRKREEKREGMRKGFVFGDGSGGGALCETLAVKKSNCHKRRGRGKACWPIIYRGEKGGRYCGWSFWNKFMGGGRLLLTRRKEKRGNSHAFNTSWRKSKARSSLFPPFLLKGKGEKGGKRIREILRESVGGGGTKQKPRLSRVRWRMANAIGGAPCCVIGKGRRGGGVFTWRNTPQRSGEIFADVLNGMGRWSWKGGGERGEKGGAASVL